MKREEELTRRRERLSEAKKALLAERLQSSLQRKALNVSIKRREAGQKTVLSFAQQRLWFLDQLVPSNPFYNIPLAIHLDGLLDVPILLRCLQKLIQRHESLRTNFVMNGDGPVQVIAEEDRLSLPMIDLRDIPEEQQRPTVQQLSEIEAQRPFDLANGALMRSTLLRLKPQNYILLITMHHIISDGWSIGILHREMTVLYQALREGAASPLPPLPLQYADYALWQRERLQGELLQKQLAYWRHQLASLAPLDLPLDHPRPPLQTFRGSVLSFTLPTELVGKIRAWCRHEGITLFIVLLSAFQMLLARYTGSDDIAVGTPISGRTRAELEGLVGFFVNTLVIRTDLSGNSSLRDIVHAVRKVAEAAFNHQDVPFEKLVEELRPERNVSQNPLIQTLFTLKVPVDNTREIAQLHLHAYEQERQTTQFDLMLAMSEVQDHIVGQFQYNTNLFDIRTVQRIAEHFSVLLQAIVNTPQQPLWDTPILSYEEQRKILYEWNATETSRAVGTVPCASPPLRDLCLHQLVERQVEQTPDSVALGFHEDETLTYTELNRRANQLAHYLQRLGVGPDVFVGVCLPRSIEMVVGLLAALKAGGAYVPLDSSYPRERLIWMLADSQATIVLTHHLLDDRLGLAFEGIRSIHLDTDWHVIAKERQENPQTSIEPAHLAYLIYTSGSTGKPKGAMNTHQGICNLLYWLQQAYQLTPKDRVLQKTSFSFDVSVWELFWPLTTGAGLIVARPDGHQDPGYLKALITEQNVSTLHFVPSMLQAFLIERNLQSCGSLRQVMCGGETLEASLQARFFARVGDEVQLHNLYGPTEAAIDVTFWQCQRGSSGWNVPIGRPIANTQIYLLDRNQQPVPIGVTGELYIGGVGLARGYARRPDLTAERFVPHPWGSLSGERLYRTGDLARYRADGTIEFLGRMDQQVKLRGFRIEPGEIEATLQAHPAVQRAVVMLYEADRIGHYLVAYVVGQGSDLPPTQAELQSYLREQLPDYMVPTVFVSLETLPLTLNGKLNRKALPVPERTAQSEEGYVAPQSELEQRLSEIWQQVLGMQTQVGVYDNFFDLGGHSLLLIQVRSKLEAYLGYDVPVVDLLQYPTIHALSTHLSGRQEQQALLPPIAERVRKRKGALSTEELQTSHDGIAIVGLTGRFPGARNIDEFWQNLCHGVESISFFSEEDLLASGIEPELIHDPRYVKAHGILDDVESFDAAFFGYSPKEAAMMDPQQRLFLECAWEVLEQAGYNPESTQGLIGVYAGQSVSSYLLSNLWSNRPLIAETGIIPTLISNDKDFLATRTSYKLNLEGPSITIQTACSTSLVAVHMACQGLLHHECDMALAGGASIVVPQKMGYLYEEEGILSPDGHCRAFDADARGTVAGSGVGIVTLKRLSDAVADGDTIYAVIRGSAINNDGATKVGYTAPSIKGQVKAIAQAIAMAGVEPETISYVETHGTGTALGDPIEITALTQAFRGSAELRYEAHRPDRSRQPYPQHRSSCAIGSVKTNLGHLDTAAGIAGLIKTVLSLKHGMLPPSLHFNHPNPQIDFARSPFYVNTRLTAWKTGGTPRRAGVSSFGIGGTNAHVILEEAPAIPSQAGEDNEKLLASNGSHLVVLSAKTVSALETMTQQLAIYVQAHPEASLADMAYTLQVGRKAFPYRQAFVVQERADMPHLLTTSDPESVFTGFVSGETKQVAFLFPGQGPQYINMGRELYEGEPIFRQQVDTCAEWLAPRLHCDLREIIYAPIGQEAIAQDQLDRMSVAQPAIFMIEYALAQLWMQRGLRPAAMIGHSIGEYVAACLAGVLSLEDALLLVALRGRLMDQLESGRMLAISLPEEEVIPKLSTRLSLAAHNSPTDCVVSGPTDAIFDLAQHLREQKITCQLLRVSCASHSQMVEPLLEPFINKAKKLHLYPPTLPYISNVTGKWITEQEATDPEYWATHWRQTVRFAEGMRLLLDSPNMVLLEVGPGHSLSTLAGRAKTAGTELAPVHVPPLTIPTLASAGHQLVLSSLRHPQTQVSDRAFLLNTCGRLWCAGVAIDWSQFDAGSQRRRIPLPTYPFERKRYWTLPVSIPTAPSQSRQKSTSARLRKEPDLARWFSVPSWKRSPLPAIQPKPSEGKPCWLIFADDTGLGTCLGEKLAEWGRAQKQEAVGAELVPAQEVVITIHVGTEFRRHWVDDCSALRLSGNPHGTGNWEYTLRPDNREDYDALLSDIDSHGLFPTHIAHLWSVIATDRIPPGLDYFETAQALGFYSLLFLIQALGERNRGVGGGAGQVSQEIALITNNLQEVMGGEVLCPARATALGVGKVASCEYPHITFRCIDVVLPVTIGQQPRTAPTAQMEWTHEQLVDQIIAELRTPSSDAAVAYRGKHRWVGCIEPVRLEAVAEEKLPLRQQGVYLITEGLGGMGLALAEDLARRVRARLILIGRTALPAREEWDTRLATAVGRDAVANQEELAKIRQLKKLEELAAEVLAIQADVTDLEQMQAVISQVCQRFGALHGVIHTAGIPGRGLIQLKTPAMAAEVLAPKVKGTLVLEAVLKDQQPDFLILCSSITALTGPLGLVDYCAANIFLDSFACYHTVQQSVQTTSIKWDAWQEVGMAVDSTKTYKGALRLHPEVEESLQQGILPQEGVEIFRRILSYKTCSQVIVSPHDIFAVLEQTESFPLPELEEGDDGLAPPSASRVDQRPNLQTPYVAPQNETQQQIAALWQKLLGIEKVGIYDSFIDLGGHSLLGVQLINRLRDTFQVDISLRSLLERPTVAGLALTIVQKKAEFVGDELLLRDLDDIEHLTDDEVQTLLEANGSKKSSERS